MSVKVTKEEALEYHKSPNPGKVAIATTTQLNTQRDLSLAYSPGVAFPCEEIKRDPKLAYEYTAKSNLVAVVSNGTAVLGLGDIGALASKPVMEGKAVLFKKFAAVDSFDIEVDATDVDKFCEAVKAISPTFGGINLEDIKAPECFEIEKRLVDELNIPVMHDDQHGTAIITSSALLNASEMMNKAIEDIKIVVVGAGASAIACSTMYKELGVKNLIMCDSKGVIHKGRKDLNKYKKDFMIDEPLTLEEAFTDADMVLGLSRPGTFTKKHIALMSEEPIIFTLANPTPELFPEEVKEVRPKAIIGTGRSDFPNQVNNVLGFPFIFRGALDVKTRKINMTMKIAAAKAIADLAKQPLTDELKEAFGDLVYGREYIIPIPFDKRLMVEVSSAVANAAVETGVARVKEFDLEAYRKNLAALV
ncbi:malate dehydrogenase (oxaloacetate-decarboxylating)/malate dehydrogenase (oxaloacetate-decarboxylating)(NADP+) [Malaciobacter marinus]|jgi:malate dehydrogenase (oxaloacetate-decarboxylating)/malate dehydrogenase (oxaloacetate-decarboxylating)(NADP+)|uniref:Malate dehydrogenase (Oxaloacetate-decarboxylating)/malate dehydrogenase (Oxaloacetate-decarboxylating)(NADP+) n=1 Tax=Malaciobacter marinus TaxID=505249 RepID=A0AB37A1A4_9BACT|nr:malic enzyme-like NAD(P)-binding protein [Malaciobacter marinus]PPK62867.1 malate dehydrogenase (oxaloacetate-decarboxylating)/malate dehydrogenase (oxaloacetate-decarboxylating)(NADP+) [Malaciobacter marinus]SKB52476.1 malate dehydrogenase (oxaloacetate-decarboxylating)/malate dehydrogenase (oxaloacetate-decarboxylating)(NADP+) [Malaciobacter marinus]